MHRALSMKTPGSGALHFVKAKQGKKGEGAHTCEQGGALFKPSRSGKSKAMAAKCSQTQ